MDKQYTIDHQLQILTLILSENQCNKCIRIAKEKGIRGGIVTIGKGTVSSSVLNLLGIKSQKKEVVNFLLEYEKAKEMLDCFTKELQLHEPGHGIAYTTPVLIINNNQITRNTVNGMEEEDMYKKLSVIVDRGMAEEVMDIARKAGVRGGTIMHGRGVGAEHTEKLFGVEIEPEKEIVLILTPGNLIDKVIDALNQELQLGKEGKGVLFVEPVLETRGLFEPNHNSEEDIQ